MSYCALLLESSFQRLVATASDVTSLPTVDDQHIGLLVLGICLNLVAYTALSAEDADGVLV